MTIQDLQQQLKIQCHSNGALDSISPASSLGLLSSQEDLHKEVESLRLERELHENEGFVLQKTIDELSTRLENQQQSLMAKDDTIARMMEMLKKNQENKNAMEQQESERKLVEKYKADMNELKVVMDEKEKTISSLQEVRKIYYYDNSYCSCFEKSCSRQWFIMKWESILVLAVGHTTCGI